MLTIGIGSTATGSFVEIAEETLREEIKDLYEMMEEVALKEIKDLFGEMTEREVEVARKAYKFGALSIMKLME